MGVHQNQSRDTASTATHLGIDVVELDGEVVRVVDTKIKHQHLCVDEAMGDVRHRHSQVNRHAVRLQLDLI